MAVETLTDRPPYVVWEMRQVEDRAASEAAGHIVEKDVAFAVITRPGSRDTLDAEALVWLKKLKNTKEIPSNWYAAFQQSFDQWLKGETAEVNGTPIKGWPTLGGAAQKVLLAAGIMTVEDLAAMPDQDLQNVGTGAVSYKMKAKAWLEAANGPGKMAERLTSQEQTIADLKKLAETQAAAIAELKKTVKA